MSNNTKRLGEEPIGKQALTVNSLALPVVGAQIICSNFFQYINKPKTATSLSLSRQCLFLIPALFAMSHFFGLDGIFYAQSTSDLLSASFSCIWVFFALKNPEKENCSR